MRWNARNRSGTTGFKRPTIVYDVDDDEIFVALPFPAIGPDKPWGVSLDGDVRDVHCVRQWGASTDASITRAVISLPVREVVLSHGPSEVEAALAIVSKTDPLLTHFRQTAAGHLGGQRAEIRTKICRLSPPTRYSLRKVTMNS